MYACLSVSQGLDGYATFSQTAPQLESHMWYGIPQAEVLVHNIGRKTRHEEVVAASRVMRSSDGHRAGGMWCADSCLLVMGPETEGTGRAGSERPCEGVRCPPFTSAPAALSPAV